MNETPQRIAVTGAAGGIGSAVADRLAADGHELVLLDVKPIEHAPKGAKTIQVDSRDQNAVSKAFEGMDVVCHIGEVPNIVNVGNRTPEQVFDENVAICRSVLDAATTQRVKRLIYTSSCQVYGFWGHGCTKDRIPMNWPLTEDEPLRPTNKYAESKLANEQQCRSTSEASALEVLIFRLPWVIPPHAMDGKLKERWRDADQWLFEGFWTHLAMSDAVEAYALAVRRDRPMKPLPTRCEAFHFVDDEAVGALPIREKLGKFLSHAPRLPDNWPARMPPVDCRKAQAYLGWQPTFPMRETVERG